MGFGDDSALEGEGGVCEGLAHDCAAFVHEFDVVWLHFLGGPVEVVDYAGVVGEFWPTRDCGGGFFAFVVRGDYGDGPAVFDCCGLSGGFVGCCVGLERLLAEFQDVFEFVVHFAHGGDSES